MNRRPVERQQPVVIRQSKIDAYVEKIERSWHKTLESIFAVGDLINEARKDLADDEFKILLGSLSFGVRSAQRLSAIANDKRLRKPRLMKMLPACWTTLYEIHGFTDRQLQEVRGQDWFTPRLTREELCRRKSELKVRSSRSRRIKSDVRSKVESKGKSSPVLLFEVPIDFKNHKALLDVHFICGLVQALFKNVPGKPKIEITAQGWTPSRKLVSSYGVLSELIEEVRKIENFKRARQGKAALNRLQEILSLIGCSPDQTGTCGFSLMERLAKSYAERQGVDFIQEQQFKWAAATSDAEPELLGSFLEDVQQHVSSILAGKAPKRPETKIYELDFDGESNLEGAGELRKEKGSASARRC